MVNKHCGQQTVAKSNNPVYFTRQCVVCKRVFKQHKRRPAKKVNNGL